MTADTPTDYETLYKAAVDHSDLSPVSRGGANAVVDRLLENRNDPTSTDLTRRIQEAASQGNIDMIFQLTAELREVKTAESERNQRLVKLAEEFSFLDVLRAYPSDFKALTYELGLLVLQKTEHGLKTTKRPARPRTSPAASAQVYVIMHNGESIEAVKNTGKTKRPDGEREFFEFLGFEISEDGRTLDPATFVNAKGEVTQSNSKKAVIEDLLAGNKLWTDRGFRIKLKEATPA